MDIFLTTIQTIGTWLLVIMGAVVAVRPPKRSQHGVIARWIAAFLVVGGIVSAAQFLEQQRSAKAFEKLETAITGGDNYVYLSVRSVIAQNGENFLAANTTGSIPRSDFSIHALSEDGQVIFKREHTLRPLPHTTAHFPITLPPGRFRISFIMGEKRWIEYLDFQRTNEGVDQVYWVERDGIVIREGPE